MELDVSSLAPDLERLYPKHGWAENSQQVKLVRLPLLELIRSARKIRGTKGASTDFNPNYGVAFDDRMRQLTRCLSHLARIRRQIVSLEDPGSHFAYGDLVDIALFSDLAVIQLRRAADDLAMAIRPLVFRETKNWPGGASAFKALRTFFGQEKNLVGQEYLVDEPSDLASVFCAESWYDDLRKDKDKAVTDVRTILEHRTSRVITGVQRSGDGPWRVTAQLYSPAADAKFFDLISEIRSMVDRMCDFMTQLAQILTDDRTYSSGDWIIFIGDDDDAAEFWPPIISNPDG